MAIKIKSENEVKIKNVKKGQEKRIADSFLELNLKYGQSQAMNPILAAQQPAAASPASQTSSVPEGRTVTPAMKPTMGGSFWQGNQQRSGTSESSQPVEQTPATFQPSPGYQPGAPQPSPAQGITPLTPASGMSQPTQPGPATQTGDAGSPNPRDVFESQQMGAQSQGPQAPSIPQSSSHGRGVNTGLTSQAGTGAPPLRQKISQELGTYGTEIRKSGRKIVSIAYHNYSREMEGALFGSNPKSKEFRMLKPMSNVGVAIIADVGMQYKNEQIVKQITSSNSEMLGILSRSNQILYNNKMSVNQDFKLGGFKDFKRLRNQTDALFLSKGYGMVSNLNEQGIKDMAKKLEAGGHSDLIELLDVQKAINGNTDGGLSMMRNNSHRITTSLMRTVGRNIDESETYQGYMKMKSTKHALKLGLKTIKYPAQTMWKAEKALYGKAADGLEIVFRKANFNTAANVVQSLHSVGTHVSKAGEHAVSMLYHSDEMLSNIVREKTLVASTQLKNAATQTTRTVGKAAANAAQQSVNYMGKTRVGRFASKIGNKKIGKKTLSNRVSVIGKFTKNGVKKVLSIQKAPFKLAKMGIQKIVGVKAVMSAVIGAAKAVLMKVALPALAVILVLITILGAFSSIIGAISAVGDAVSPKAHTIKESSMNAAYNKLLEKELRFSQAIQDIATSAENIPQEYSDEHGITVYTDLDVKFVDGNGSPLEETSTIKQILAMAAIYIEQDFEKYGQLSEGALVDSVYKDYCAKLYDASHIIAVAPPDNSGEGIYYCSKGLALDGDDSGEVADELTDTNTKGVATDDCNNPTKQTIYTRQTKDNHDDDPSESWSEKLKKYKEDYSMVAYERYRSSKDEYAGYYTIAQTGPHGKSSQMNDNSERFDERVDEAEETLKAKGCENYELVHTGYHDGGENGDDYDYYTLVCTCPKCKGHLDATTYVYIGNIFDPNRDGDGSTSAENPEESTESTEGAEGTSKKKKKKDKAYDNIDKKDAEQKYSLYTVDKYATAFDLPTNSEITSMDVFCTNMECISNSAGANPTVVTITKDDPKCPLCGTELPFSVGGKPGDQASCDEADASYSSYRYAAEKAIMDDITGKDTTIVEWWNNDGWFQTWFETTPCYYRLYDESKGSIDSLKRPEKTGDEDQDRNIVNKSNSTPYKFNSFTEPSLRNNNFAKHGWDNDSISQVRMLLAADWDELYGLKNFGGLNIISTGIAGSLGAGTGMSEAQIAQLLANNTAYEDLCDDRKALMATCLEFYSEINRLGVNYHGAMCTANSIAQLKTATSKSQYFTTGYPNNICTADKVGKYHCNTDPGIDCSGFVSWIASATFPGQFPKKVSTGNMFDYVGSKLIPVSQGSLLPGDIALKNGHVLMYIGNGQWAEAAGHKEGVRYGSTHSASYFSKYGFYRFSWIDETKHTISFELEEEEEIEEVDE